MVKASDVMKLVEKNGGRINVSLLEKELGLPPDKACQYLLKLAGMKKLLPMNTAFFAPPDEDGNPAPFISGRNRDWHKGRREAVLQYVEKQHPMGVGVTEVAAHLEATKNVARTLLNGIVEEGLLVSMQSEYGGSFGKRPFVYGKDLQALKLRENQFHLRQDEVMAARKKGRKKKPDLPDPAEGYKITMKNWADGVPMHQDDVAWLEENGYHADAKRLARELRHREGS